MLTDDEFAQQLGVRLHAEVADLRAAPGLTATLRRRQARRALAVRTTVATPVAAAVVAVALVANTGQGGQPGRPAGSSAASAMQLRDVAYVKTQTTNALDKASNYVMHVYSTRTGGGSNDMWSDPATGRERGDNRGPDSTPVESYAVGAGATGDWTFLTIDYTRRTWWTTPWPKSQNEPLLPGPLPPPVKVGQGMPLRQVLTLVAYVVDPARIRDALGNGTLRLLGQERIGGHETLHLHLTVGANGLPEILPMTLDLWVDAVTFLPYREIASMGSSKSTADYAWLARTPANLAHLDLPVPPAGFTHRP
jgi:hypothetical protein